MKEQKINFKSKTTIIKTCVFLGMCFVLLLSLFFSQFFEKLLNNTWVFYNEDFISSPVKVHFIDVGQGDCSFIQVGNTSIMIDAGTPDSANSTIRYLNNLGFNKNDKIDYLILSHTDLDHVGGAEKLLEEFEFCNIYMPKIYSNYEVENNLNVNDYNIDDSSFWERISKQIYNEVSLEHLFYNFMGEKIEGANFSLNFYTPLKDNFSYSNSYSPIIVLTCENFKAMFVGDASYVDEYSFLSYYSDLVNHNFFDCNVLKVGHHGSKNSTTVSFLDAVKPEISVISVGDNSYGHPTKEVLDNLNNAGSYVLRTDLTGSIALYCNDKSIKTITNFNFVGIFYFRWWYFVVTFIVISFFATISFKKQ